MENKKIIAMIKNAKRVYVYSLFSNDATYIRVYKNDIIDALNYSYLKVEDIRESEGNLYIN